MYSLFNIQHIKPTGWLRRQLEIQASGLSGHLDKVWPDVRDSAWLGGDRDGWERLPYWLDGFIPLAYLLDDPDMKSRSDKYVKMIITRRDSDGWICPCHADKRGEYDLWAYFLICKVLSQYCEITRDVEAHDALYHAMFRLYEMLAAGETVLFKWGKYRWFEALIPLCYLYDNNQEDWMLRLGEILRDQGADYTSFTDLWRRPMNKWTYETHIVNIGMMFKYESLISRLFGTRYNDYADKLWHMLDKYNGTVTGIFTGDECLAGVYNNHGSELCAVVELMYSCEMLFAVTGDTKWADRLEKIAFNALPATFTDDMWAHQYDQSVNQIACIRFPGKSFFRTNGSEAHLFGLEPNYGCCTADFSQGWPKFAANVFLSTSSGILCVHPLPSTLDTDINGVHVIINVESDYPFRSTCRYTVTTDAPVAFTLGIRIPGAYDSAALDGKSVRIGSIVEFNRKWTGTNSFELSLTALPHFTKRPHALNTVEYGPLVFSLPIKTEYRMREYTAKDVERKFPYCDYELIPCSDWNYGFSSDKLSIKENSVASIPFSSSDPPLTVTASVRHVRWTFADGYDSVADVKPLSRQGNGDDETVGLIPFGCAKLRMTEMPFLAGAKINGKSRIK